MSSSERRIVEIGVELAKHYLAVQPVQNHTQFARPGIERKTSTMVRSCCSKVNASSISVAR